MQEKCLLSLRDASSHMHLIWNQVHIIHELDGCFPEGNLYTLTIASCLIAFAGGAGSFSPK
jgi:hypothetical protein